MINAEFIDLIVRPEVLVSVFISVAAFATVLTVVMPVLDRDRMAHRMRSMVVERDKMLAKRFASNTNVENNSGLVRQNAHGWVRTFVDRLNLKSKFENDALKSKLKMAGLHGQAPIYGYVFFRMIMPPIVFLAALFYLFVLEVAPTYSSGFRLMLAFGAGAVGYYLPNIFIENRIQKRKQAIKDAFPDALDMLLICVQSGMSVEAGFGRVAQEIGNRSIELAEEFSLTTAELSYLPERRQAYQNLGERTGIEAVQATTTALIQAENYGTPVGQALRVMAKENRDLRMMEAEKKAAALPPKLTVPMMLFFLPGLFVVILGPVGVKLIIGF